MVYDALKELEGVKPKKPQWRVAQDLRIVSINQRIDASDTGPEAFDKRNVMTAIVGRYKKGLPKQLN